MFSRFLFILQLSTLLPPLTFANAQVLDTQNLFDAPWKVDTDGGDFPEIAGCTKTSGTSVCSNGTIEYFDRCGSNGELNEAISTSSCIENATATTRTLNCNTYCMKKYSLPGECRTAAIVVSCANDTNVGYCLCGDR